MWKQNPSSESANTVTHSRNPQCEAKPLIPRSERHITPHLGEQRQPRTVGSIVSASSDIQLAANPRVKSRTDADAVAGLYKALYDPLPLLEDPPVRAPRARSALNRPAGCTERIALICVPSTNMVGSWRVSWWEHGSLEVYP